MQVRKLGATIAGIVLIGATLGCTNTYRIDHYDAMPFHTKRGGFAEINNKNFLERGLDNLVFLETKGIVSQEFLGLSKTNSYSIEEVEYSHIGGFWRKRDDEIRIILSGYQDCDVENSTKDSLKEYSSSKVLYHELLHSYWDKRMTKMEQDSFRKEIFALRDKYHVLKKEIETIKSQADIGKILECKDPRFECDILEIKFYREFEQEAIPLTNEFYQNHGFTRKSYENFSHFMKHEAFYKENYGYRFEELFFGTEAFAYLGEMELSVKTGELELIDILKETIRETSAREEKFGITEFEKLILKSNKKNLVTSEKRGSSIEYLPTNIKGFYEGVFGPHLINH